MQFAITIVAFWTGAIALAGLLGIAMRAQLPPLLAIAAAAALTAHGSLLLTATLAAGFSRFTLGLWPAIVTATMFGVWTALPSRLTAR
jgi:hypothetical protein